MPSAAIHCLGDSLTFGTGASTSQDYPSVLAMLTGRTVENLGVPGEDSSQILTRVLALTIVPGDIYILWMGHNNDGADGRPTRDQNVLDIADAVAHIVAGGGNYLVMAVLNRTYEPLGEPLHAELVAMNAALGAAYPDNYVGIREFLVHQGPDDADGHADHDADLIPRAFMFDSIHQTAASYALIAARNKAVIDEQGW